jgi:lambda family phage portal protein
LAITIAPAETAYRSASWSARELSSWRPSIGSADRDLLPELPTMAGRGRDLARNHGVASGAVDTLVDNVVGTGLTLNPVPDYVALGRPKEWADEWSERTASLWRNYAESAEFDAGRRLNFHGFTRLLFRTEVVEGDAVCLPLWMPGRGGRYATCFLTVDPSRLSNPDNRWDTATLRGGVEIDPTTTEPVRYHVRKAHLYDAGPTAEGTFSWEAIPARDPGGRPRFVHLYRSERPGQTRGAPAMAAVMTMFRMLDHYERAEVAAAVMNAMMCASLESSMDMTSIMELLGGDSNCTPAEQYLGLRRDWVASAKMESGTIIAPPPGDKLNFFKAERPNSQFGPFSEQVLRHIGASLGLPLELLMKDFSKTNYSSARASLLEAWRFFNNRRDWVVTHWADVAYSLWLEEAANAGDVEAPDFYANRAAWCRADWIGDGRGWIDPLKEAEASGERRRQGVSTLSRECAEQGLDYRDVVRQQVREEAFVNAERSAAGLDPLPPGAFMGIGTGTPANAGRGGTAAVDPANDAGGGQPSPGAVAA